MLTTLAAALVLVAGNAMAAEAAGSGGAAPSLLAQPSVLPVSQLRLWLLPLLHLIAPATRLALLVVPYLEPPIKLML